MKRCLVALGLALSALSACAPTGITAIPTAEIRPIPANYRDQIKVWAAGFYAEPHTLRSTRISDPVSIRDSTGRLLWLVCIEADARQRGGDYMGVQRQAIAFNNDGAPSFPLARSGAVLVREDCDTLPLTWTPFPDLAKI